MQKKKTEEDLRKEKRIKQLFLMGCESSSKKRIVAIARQILEINPNHIEALILRADNVKDPEVMVNDLKKALSALDDPDNYLGKKDALFLALNQRLAIIYTNIGDYDNAFKFCTTAIEFDESYEDNDDDDTDYDNFFDDGSNDHNIRTRDANNALMKAIFYKVLIMRQEWQKILSYSLSDKQITPGRAYAKLIAVWNIAPPNNLSICANLFFDALSISPDAPFYLMKYLDEPDDKASSESHEAYYFALLFNGALPHDDVFLSWFGRGVILFGLLSGRFKGDDFDYFVDGIERLGGYYEYARMKKILSATEDREIIKALAENKCLNTY